MQYQDFKAQILRMIKEHSDPDATVSLRTVLKNNDHKLDALLLLYPGECVSPTIYLNDYYALYQNGSSLEDICHEMLSLLRMHRCRGSFDFSFLQDFDKVKRSLCLRLVNAAANEEFLSDLPYVPYMDLAAIFFLQIDGSSQGISSMLIRKEHMKRWGVTTEILYYEAYINTRNMNQFRIIPMRTMLDLLADDLPSMCAPGSPSEGLLYVLTSDNTIFGSTGLLYKDIFADFSYQIANDFYILPSSVHELILVDIRCGTDADELLEMVREVNQTAVEHEEFLSDNIYRYYADTHKIEMITG